MEEDIDCVFYKICIHKDSQKKAELKWMEARQKAVRIRESSIRHDEAMYARKVTIQPRVCFPRRKSTSFLTAAS